MTTWKFKHQTFEHNEVVDNITVWYLLAKANLTEEEQTEALEWYCHAHNWAKRTVKIFEDFFTLEQVIGVVAALSPSNEWNRNKSDAIALLTEVYTDCEGLASGLSTYGPQIVKAFEIAHNLRDSFDLGPTAYKTINFYYCILNPDTQSHVCIDRHAVSLAMDRLEASDNLSMSSKTYGHFSEAYYEAAKRANISAPALQALTWVYYKEHVNR